MLFHSGIQDLLDNTTALGDLSHCLDRDFKHVKNWSHFAFVLGVPADVIRTCNLYLEHSPTRKLFEYLEVTRPHLRIGQLRDALIKNKAKPRFDVHDKIKGNVFKLGQSFSDGPWSSALAYQAAKLKARAEDH